MNNITPEEKTYLGILFPNFFSSVPSFSTGSESYLIYEKMVWFLWMHKDHLKKDPIYKNGSMVWEHASVDFYLNDTYDIYLDNSAVPCPLFNVPITTFFDDINNT